MLAVKELRELTLSRATKAAQPLHVSAASGLVRIGQRLYVVADDENMLAVFDLGNDEPGRVVQLFGGELPLSYSERKAVKSDLEALTRLPAFDNHPCGALLAVGSGSRRNRMQAALLRLDAAGAVDAAARRIDLTELLVPLQQRFVELNIEGAFITGGELCLLQRGNTRSPVNACIRFELDPFLRWIGNAGPVPETVCVTQHDLGSIDGVPLCFTDGVALRDGRWLFSAAAEDTADSYADGRCLGSAVGVVDENGTLQRVERLAALCKVEGVALAHELGDDADDSRLPLLLVSDADDRRIAARLLSVTLSL
jgi:hypothetical protein